MRERERARNRERNAVVGRSTHSLREHHARILLGQREVGVVAVTHQDASVRGQQLRRSLRAAAAADHVVDAVVHTQQPHVPALALAGLLAEQLPARLVRADDSMAEQIG
jgi:hypothetical protein